MRPTRLVLSLIALLAALPVRAEDHHDRFVEAARELLGVRYHFGGRLKKPGDGTDCQGVLFYAAERVGRCGWRSFSVFPTESVARAELGAAVPGLSPVSSTQLDPTHLQPGDVLLLVGFERNPAEAAIGELDGRPVWVWHTGLYSGGGKWIVGDHYAGRVIETDLRDYLARHTLYAGVFVTRMGAEGPKPQRCRTHRKMTLPRPPARSSR